MADSFRLSKQQCDILKEIYHKQVYLAIHNTNDDPSWRIQKGRNDLSQSERASRSRALKRLEERGLLVRYSHAESVDYPLSIFSECRTTHVKLTVRGEAIAKRLSSDSKT